MHVSRGFVEENTFPSTPIGVLKVIEISVIEYRTMMEVPLWAK